MNQETLEALKKSIEHWERNAKKENIGQLQLGVIQCELCNNFFTKDCEGCPVYEKTGKINCQDTPYYAVLNERRKYYRNNNSKEAEEKCKQAVQAELEFLKSLLPGK